MTSWWYPTYGHPDGATGSPRLEHDHDTGTVRAGRDPSETVLRVVDDHVYHCDDAAHPVFVIRGSFVYTTEHHPLGEQTPPWFQIRSL